jgi:CMP-N-acetylneuraminic acid synthetase
MRILGVIPARGGSKGVPRKNIRRLAGKPLLQYTVEAALGSRRLTRVILTTDDVQIAELGRQLGVEVPFLRPVELAADDTPTLPVVQHAVRELEKISGDMFDGVCLLQPTHPLRGSDIIDACLEHLEHTRADSVVTILPVPEEHNPHWVYFHDGNGFLHLSTGEEAPIPRRQLLPRAWHREGSVYAMRRDVLMNGNSLYGQRVVGFELDPERSVNIDTFHDFERAEAFLKMTILMERDARAAAGCVDPALPAGRRASGSSGNAHNVARTAPSGRQMDGGTTP